MPAGRRPPWPLRLLQRLFWLSLLLAGASVVGIMVLAAGHDVLDPSGRLAWTTAAALALILILNTGFWVGSIFGTHAWRRRYYEEVGRRWRPVAGAEETYTGYKIAYLQRSSTPARSPSEFCFRPINPAAVCYGIDSTSACRRAGAGVLCTGERPTGHKCGFHAVRVAELIGPASPAEVEWDLDRRRRRAQVLLQVNLSGQVEPGEWGYRATEQQVLHVGFQQDCVDCRRPRAAEYLTVRPWDGHELVVPVCGRHRRERSFRPVELANRLGTEVGWIAPVR